MKSVTDELKGFEDFIKEGEKQLFPEDYVHTSDGGVFPMNQMCPIHLVNMVNGKCPICQESYGQDSGSGRGQHNKEDGW
jgi:hypothetical protein